MQRDMLSMLGATPPSTSYALPEWRPDSAGRLFYYRADNDTFVYQNGQVRPRPPHIPISTLLSNPSSNSNQQHRRRQQGVEGDVSNGAQRSRDPRYGMRLRLGLVQQLTIEPLDQARRYANLWNSRRHAGEIEAEAKGVLVAFHMQSNPHMSPGEASRDVSTILSTARAAELIR